jgi:hypothetical protein
VQALIESKLVDAGMVTYAEIEAVQHPRQEKR